MKEVEPDPAIEFWNTQAKVTRAINSTSPVSFDDNIPENVFGEDDHLQNKILLSVDPPSDDASIVTIKRLSPRKFWSTVPLDQVRCLSIQPLSSSPVPLEFAHLIKTHEQNNILPPHRDFYDMEIKFNEGSTLPPPSKCYGLSPPEKIAVEKYITELLNKGYLRPSKSPLGSPVFFVPKKNGQLRLCVDYRKINSITRRNAYPLPLIDELIEKVAASGATVFTRLDLANAFNQIRISDGDEWKSAIITHLGLYEYTVMPFGLTNAPSTFQALIDSIFADCPNVVVYIDDILIFSNPSSHFDLVKMVLERLNCHHLSISPEKCEWNVNSVDFLGVHLSDKGISMDRFKLDTILEWQPPKSTKGLATFLGFTNYYRRFIKDFANISSGLYSLVAKFAKNTPIVLEGHYLVAFESLKKCFACAPLLHYVDPQKTFILFPDTSEYATGACLFQIADDSAIENISSLIKSRDKSFMDFLSPVGFYSRKLIKSELNYGPYDRELLGIIASLRHWRPWLSSTFKPLLIYSDHSNLLHFSDLRLLSRRQARWAEFLSQFNFKICHCPGAVMPADPISRREDFSLSDEEKLMNEKALFQFDENHLKLKRATLYLPPNCRNQKAQTPSYLLDEIFDAFDIQEDVTPPDNTIDSLQMKWPACVFVNPPFNDIQTWLDKAIVEAKSGTTSVFLLPLRADSRWFHQLAFNFPLLVFHKRIKFDGYSKPAPWPSCLLLISNVFLPVSVDNSSSAPFIFSSAFTTIHDFAIFVENYSNSSPLSIAQLSPVLRRVDFLEIINLGQPTPTLKN